MFFCEFCIGFVYGWNSLCVLPAKAGISVSLYFVIGELIFETSLTKLENTIDISSWAKGVYFVHILDKKGNLEVRKFVKE